MVIPMMAVAPAKSGAQATDPDAGRFAAEIAEFEAWDAKNAVPDDPVVFVGSSSIRLWNSAERFPDFPVVNRGFGGAHISDVNRYVEETTLKYRPVLVVFYAGDNDIADGKTAAQVLEDYREFATTVLDAGPSVRIVFISIKPSLARWSVWPRMMEANEMIRSYSESRDELYTIDLATPMLGEDGTPRPDIFLEDGLHMNEIGYDIWSGRLAPFLDSIR
jgi:lysophospholipase L1-like esterase